MSDEFWDDTEVVPPGILIMKKSLLLLAAILAGIPSAHAKLNVVATLPDFGALARASNIPPDQCPHIHAAKTADYILLVYQL